MEKLPGGLCEGCEKEIADHNRIVEEGGIFFKCKCGTEGVVRESSELAKEVRKNLGVAAPAHCGVKFEECVKCSPDSFQ